MWRENIFRIPCIFTDNGTTKQCRTWNTVTKIFATSKCCKMWPGPRLNSMPSFIMIQRTVFYNTPTSQRDRQTGQTGQRSDSIVRTILQTVAYKWFTSAFSLTLKMAIWIRWLNFDFISQSHTTPEIKLFTEIQDSGEKYSKVHREWCKMASCIRVPNLFLVSVTVAVLGEIFAFNMAAVSRLDFDVWSWRLFIGTYIRSPIYVEIQFPTLKSYLF